MVLEFIAECGYGADCKDCALALLGLVLVFTAACCSSSKRLSVHGSSDAGVERTVIPHVEKTVKILQLQLVGGTVLG